MRLRDVSCHRPRDKRGRLNVVLGPAADCNSNPQNSIIGMRSFGEQPMLVARMTAAAVRGLQENGSVATLKHFPGHGDTRPG